MTKGIKRRVEIIFEDTGQAGGKGFNVFLTGIDRERMNLPEDQLSPSEWWGASMFKLVGAKLQQAGVVQTTHRRGSDH